MVHKAQSINKNMEMINLSDTDKYPAISSDMENIFNLKYINDPKNQNNLGYYEFEGRPVPRVSHILDFCGDKSWLIDWAGTIGKRRADDIKEKALYTGSQVHEMIEYWLKNRKHLYNNKFKGSDSISKSIYTAYNNFLSWEKQLNLSGYYIEEVVGSEIPLVCPYFGGTCDMIVRINGAYYVIDFKTSKRLSSNYILQVSIYYWMINNGYCKKIDHVNGVGLIRVDKTKRDTFEDLFLNEFIPYQNESLRYYIFTFGAYLNAWYYGNDSIYRYKDDTSKYIREVSLRGNI